jgi:hypothetical protein
MLGPGGVQALPTGMTRPDATLRREFGWAANHAPGNSSAIPSKTFDLGASTVQDGVVLVSDQANGTSGFREFLMSHHGKPVRPAQRPDWRPDPRHLDWHLQEVFKDEARHRG